MEKKNAQEMFQERWETIEQGGPLSIAALGGALFKEGGRYFFTTSKGKKRISQQRARAELHAEIQRLLDLQRGFGERENNSPSDNKKV